LIPDILNQTKHTYSKLIRGKAIELGFTACGFAPVRSMEEHRDHLQSWLDAGYHGTMDYMVNHFEKRLDPAKLVEGAKSVISVLLNYYPASKQRDSGSPVISKYAYGKDYHYVINNKLNDLLIFINSEISHYTGRAFVDSAPLLERAWAKEAGLGWIGKNSLLIHPDHGSFLFIGELITDIELEYDSPFSLNRCGSCTRCIDACPTGAIISPATLDARKCISYLTIETKEEIPDELKAKLSNRILGCDICQDVCPWNKKATPTKETDFMPVSSLLDMTGEEWNNLDKPTYNKIFRHSAASRAGFKRIIRNIRYLNETKSY